MKENRHAQNVRRTEIKSSQSTDFSDQHGAARRVFVRRGVGGSEGAAESRTVPADAERGPSVTSASWSPANLPVGLVPFVDQEGGLTERDVSLRPGLIVAATRRRFAAVLHWPRGRLLALGRKAGIDGQPRLPPIASPAPSTPAASEPAPPRAAPPFPPPAGRRISPNAPRRPPRRALRTARAA